MTPAEVAAALAPVREILPALPTPRRRKCIAQLLAMVEQVDEDGEGAFSFLTYVLCSPGVCGNA